MIETGADVKTGRLATYEQTLAEVRDECLVPARELKKKFKFKENHPLRRMSDATRNFIAEHDMLLFILDKMDGFTAFVKKGAENFGPNRNLLGHKLAAAQDRRDLMRKELNDKLKPHINQLSKSAKASPKVLRVPIEIPELLKRDGRQWDFNKVLAIALNMGNDTNIIRIADGYGLVSEEELNARVGNLEGKTKKEMRDIIHKSNVEIARAKLLQIVKPVLSESDWQSVQSIWDIVNSYWPELSAEHYKINHFHQKKVEANEIKVFTKDGVEVNLKGGYYPIKYDGSLAKKVAGWDEKDLMLNDSIWGHPNVKNGMLQTRQRVVRMPVDLSLNVLFTHLEDTIHYITHAAIIKDIDRITQDAEYQRVMEDKLGDAVYRTIRPALRNIARPERSLGLQFDRFVDRARVLTTAYILGANASVAAKQIFSLPGAVSDMGAGNYLKGLIHVLRNPLQAYESMHELSIYMETRSKSFDREIRESGNAILKKNFAGMDRSLKDMFRDAVFIPIRVMDFAAVYPAWHGAYSAEMKKSGDIEQAVRYADEVIRASQPSSKPIDLSKIQFSRNSAARLFSMFMTFTIKYGNRQRYFYRAWREGSMSTPQYLKRVGIEAIAPPAMMNLLFATLWGEDWEPEDAAVDVLLYQFSGYILARDFASAVGSSVKGKLLDKKTYQRSVGESPVFTGLELSQRAVNSIIGIMEDAGDDENFEKAAWAIAEIVSFEVGVPASRIARNLIEGARQYEEDEGTFVNILIPNPEKRGR